MKKKVNAIQISPAERENNKNAKKACTWIKAKSLIFTTNLIQSPQI